MDLLTRGSASASTRSVSCSSSPGRSVRVAHRSGGRGGGRLDAELFFGTTTRPACTIAGRCRFAEAPRGGASHHHRRRRVASRCLRRRPCRRVRRVIRRSRCRCRARSSSIPTQARTRSPSHRRAHLRPADTTASSSSAPAQAAVYVPRPAAVITQTPVAVPPPPPPPRGRESTQSRLRRLTPPPPPRPALAAEQEIFSTPAATSCAWSRARRNPAQGRSPAPYRTSWASIPRFLTAARATRRSGS